ncbi:MAG TPA: flagellar assembly protein FliX [Afipia sp.]
MRIYGPNGTTPGSPVASSRRTGGAGFSLGGTSTTSETRAASAPRAASGIDALLAMQGVEDSTERRRRSVARGRNALDLLDDLKIGLLSGTLDSSMAGRLRAVATELKSTSGDPGLDQVLSEIDLRVEVELAKAGV